MNYPKRLIEVDLPIKRISAHARREKSIRHGHISTLHIWWARRPLAACRAVICAALWPDPADPLCPLAFRDKARKLMLEWTTHERQALLSAESRPRFEAARQNPKRFDDVEELRKALLDFIADFSNWDNSTKKEYLETSRALTQSAHEALGGEPGTKPLVVDPFAGGGSIPLEALRVGADTFAGDLNPVAVLLNKVVLEYIPKYGKRLSDEVRKWGEWIKKEAEKELAKFYPKDPDGSTPIAYLWARTINCEGPGCGAKIPIISDCFLAKRRDFNIILQFVTNLKNKTVNIDIVEQSKAKTVPEGTVRRSSVTCPICNYTTPAPNVRKQFHNREGGTKDAQLLVVVTSTKGNKTRSYREATTRDMQIVQTAQKSVASLLHKPDGLSPIPNETLPYLRSIFNVNLLGVTQWGQLFTARQALQLATFSQIIRRVSQKISDQELSTAVCSCLGVVLDKMADFHTSLSSWISVGEKIGHTFGRQALGIIWDYAEANPFADISGSWDRCISYLSEVIENNICIPQEGDVQQFSATENPLPDDSVAAVITDPPYYDLIPYADLSDFFYVWLKRTIGDTHRKLFGNSVSHIGRSSCRVRV